MIPSRNGHTVAAASPTNFDSLGVHTCALISSRGGLTVAAVSPKFRQLSPRRVGTQRSRTAVPTKPEKTLLPPRRHGAQTSTTCCRSRSEQLPARSTMHGEARDGIVGVPLGLEKLKSPPSEEVAWPWSKSPHFASLPRAANCTRSFFQGSVPRTRGTVMPMCPLGLCLAALSNPCAVEREHNNLRSPPAAHCTCDLCAEERRNA